MNHIQYYDKIIADLSISFDARFTLIEFHKCTYEQQTNTLHILNQYMKHRDDDLMYLQKVGRD
jgi:hypothetical protein